MSPSLKKDVIPLYSRVAASIRNKILNGQYAPGSRLRTENEMVDHYGVSKITVRNALALLESEDLISRTRAKGTFVADSIPVKKHIIFTSFNDLRRFYENNSQGPVDIARLRVGQTRVPREINRFFDYSAEDEVMQMRHITSVSRKPIYFFENFLPVKFADFVSPDSLIERRQVLAELERALGLVVGHGDMQFEAVPLDADIAGALECQTFDPSIRIQIRLWFTSGEPFEMINAFMHADYFKYKVDIDMNAA